MPEWRRGLRLGGLLLLALLPGLHGAWAGDVGPAASAIYGDWLTGDHRGVIRITACGEAICGQIVGQDWKPGHPQPVDNHGQIECGQVILQGSRSGPLLWNGHITDPDDGSRYSASFRLVTADRMALRGYILLPLFGQTQDWTRWSGAIGDNCRFTPPRG